jgi:hypothetical protein
MTDQNQTAMNMNNGQPDLLNSQVKSKSSRPFTQAMHSYKNDFLEKSLMKAIAQLAEETDKTRYVRVKLPLFSTIEVDVIDQNNEVKTYSYPIHKIHYGPIDKNIVHYNISLSAGVSEDFIRAKKFCYRDQSIWIDVNGDGKNPGGDGTGFGGTACSPFRDIQMRLRDQGYYLLDVSEYIFDEVKNKWYFKIDIRLYQSLDAVVPRPNLWHQYGLIPGLGPLMMAKNADQINVPTSTPTSTSTSTSTSTPTSTSTSTSTSTKSNVDHGDLDVEKAVPRSSD